MGQQELQNEGAPFKGLCIFHSEHILREHSQLCCQCQLHSRLQDPKCQAITLNKGTKDVTSAALLMHGTGPMVCDRKQPDPIRRECFEVVSMVGAVGEQAGEGGG